MKIINAKGKILYLRVIYLMRDRGFEPLPEIWDTSRRMKDLKEEALRACKWWNELPISRPVILLPDGLDVQD